MKQQTGKKEAQEGNENSRINSSSERGTLASGALSFMGYFWRRVTIRSSSSGDDAPFSESESESVLVSAYGPEGKKRGMVR